MTEEAVPIESVTQPVTPVPPVPQTSEAGTSKDTKTIVTILLLIFVYPIGFLMMWFWTQWKIWVKILVSVLGCLPLLAFIGIFGVAILAAINPQAQIQKANCLKACTAEGKTQEACVSACATGIDSTVTGQYPAVFRESYLQSCTASGTVSETLCECILGKLETNYSYEEVLKELPNISNPSSSFYQTMQTSIQECK